MIPPAHSYKQGRDYCQWYLHTETEKKKGKQTDRDRHKRTRAEFPRGILPNAATIPIAPPSHRRRPTATVYSAFAQVRGT